MPDFAARIFKTLWFGKAARAARISNRELYDAARELAKGLGADLGGNVWKKRLDKNRHRSIVVSRVGACWIFVYLFAKKDRENITDLELRAFRKLAKDYSRLKPAEIDRLVHDGELQEICHGEQTVQKRRP
ncbi:type II toxin-antitoxin system RelE/ParE family toxin [Paraburkholderia sp. SUR17]|uniref:type II toxin-antitoxin system RelE/ParE family toxin n=1 Tax=Paraburkholderia sp. SUR17 TaxID=3034358 RepID=UPI00240846E8|nr:type II toxin-antitoxin system RelE/ParE family toxin [Paraburkholderia sp. SUR17]WEY38963.1 type II toxin-antitoxin system RelE/ParE family toxin [Paraburkholderia sp. SUR17]